MVRVAAALSLILTAAHCPADPDLRDGMPEAIVAGRDLSGSLRPSWAKHTRFAVVGDFGMQSGAPESVAAMIRSWEPDFIISTGDNTYGPLDYVDIRPDLEGIQTGWDEYVGAWYGDYIQRRADGRYPNRARSGAGSARRMRS